MTKNWFASRASNVLFIVDKAFLATRHELCDAWYHHKYIVCILNNLKVMYDSSKVKMDSFMYAAYACNSINFL